MGSLCPPSSGRGTSGSPAGAALSGSLRCRSLHSAAGVDPKAPKAETLSPKPRPDCPSVSAETQSPNTDLGGGNKNNLSRLSIPSCIHVYSGPAQGLGVGLRVQGLTGWQLEKASDKVSTGEVQNNSDPRISIKGEVGARAVLRLRPPTFKLACPSQNLENPIHTWRFMGSYKWGYN